MIHWQPDTRRDRWPRRIRYPLFALLIIVPWCAIIFGLSWMLSALEHFHANFR